MRTQKKRYGEKSTASGKRAGSQIKKGVLEVLNQILIHICVISCIVVAVIHILDWYNPYMDFAGHIAFAEPCLIISALLLSIEAFLGRKGQSL